MFQWIKKKLIEKEMKKLTTKKGVAIDELTEELKQTTNEYKQAMKESEELRRIMTMRNRINELRRKTRELEQQYNEDDDEDEYDDEEEDEDEDFLEGMVKNTLQNVVKAKMGGAGALVDIATTPKTSVKKGDISPETRAKLEEILGKIPEDKLLLAMEKYGHLIA